MTQRQPTLQLRPRRSLCLLLWLGILHAAALGAVWLSALVGPYKLVLSLVLLGQFGVSWRHHGHRVPQLALYWHPDGHWTIDHPTAGSIAVREWAVPVAEPFLILLRLRRDRRPAWNIALCPDSLAPEIHRQLRVRLRGYRVAERGA